MPEIMTASQFKNKSSKRFARRTNPIIRDIDKLLELYHRSADNRRRQLKILVLLYVWAKQYLYGGGSRGGVRELLGEVEAKLRDPRTELDLKMAHQGAREKGGVMTSLPGQYAKSMNQGYRMEPLLPGKGSVGGVQLQHQTKRINTPALRALFEDKITEELDRQGAQYTMKGVIQQAEEAMASAPITEFLDIFVSFTHSPAYASRVDFEYCTKDQRKSYRVHIDEQSGRFFADEHFQIPYTTDVGGPGWGLYAFDTSFRLYVKNSRDVADGAFNHSSFLSGKPAICAGAIEIDAGGRLRVISNESGHYRPSPGDLGHMLAILHDEFNVSLDAVEVTVSSAGGHTKLNGTACMNIYRNYPKSRLTDF